jgi:MATE family multidrug resistance protein
MSLIWKEKPLRELIRLAGPIAASTISYSLMTMTDTLLMGHVGRSELAGVALGGLFCFVLIGFSFGMLRGANTLVSQAVGAGRLDQVASYRGAALLSALGLGLVTVGVGQLAARLTIHLTATPAAGQAAATYLAIRILGAPVALSYVALREVRYGCGDARSPMRATVLANLVNIALAYLLVFQLHHGVAGAAVATLIANAVELAVLAWPLGDRGAGGGAAPPTARFALLAGLRRTGRAELRALWRIGTPSGVQFVLEIGSFAILSLLISLLSEAEMAAHQIALQVIHFSFLPVWAVGEAAAVLAGQAVGANEDGLVVRVGRLAGAITGLYSGACALLMAGLAGFIVSGFSHDAGVLGAATKLLHVAAVFQVFDAINVVSRGLLRGTGDVRYSAIVGVVTAWICTPPLTWLLGWRLGLGAYGGWLGLCLEIIVGSAILAWRVERRGWAEAARQGRLRLASEPRNDNAAPRAGGVASAS